jgi:hypothetical protein
MKSNEAAPAEKRLCEMLDAIETGLLHLRRERDELRETLKRVGNLLGSPVSVPTASNAESVTSTAQSKKSKSPKKAVVKKAVAKKAVAKKVHQPATDSESRPKTAPKVRQALGRTLIQIRPRRDGNSGGKAELPPTPSWEGSEKV